VLHAIDRKGGFAPAAAELCRVPSAVSYTVQKLEKDPNSDNPETPRSTGTKDIREAGDRRLETVGRTKLRRTIRAFLCGLCG